jgi:cation:H+ antiporter
MTLTILLLILGFVILIKGAHWLVNGSVSVAKHYRISELATGWTIVAFGTSVPELVVNIISSAKGYNDIAIGNIIGSNIFFILGVSSLIATINFNRSFHVDISILIGSSVLLFSFMFSGKKYKLDRWEPAILLMGYAG